MEPQVIKKDGFQIIGYRFEANLQEIKNEAIIKKAIAKLKEQANNISNRIGDHIYLVQIYPMKENFDAMIDRFISMVGFEVSEVGNRPGDTAVHAVPENMYAFYTHLGLEEDLHHAYNYLYGKWLYDHCYESLGYDLERWDERYRPEEPDNEIDMYIAIKKR
ncbi:GyrI-like domain-containing protein [Virgibacillus sp. 179-BFC.A HS]|uniref:GyrI-like domain-containing protein n=1 Tax=Tigheibacillus jepli TaxID=3035914 RepID=A0ABU5CLK8_9BACI|nr:GyrI-like domain-containing protein [Virgibacillus sp. 179-BFC.A HS]MDY0407254.1 GyrI-like domain-containing protein [Virgibacillus sp. 179-BFC.A HS]